MKVHCKSQSPSGSLVWKEFHPRGDSASGCATAGSQAPAVWDWGLVFPAEWYKEIKLSLGKYFLALESPFFVYLAVYHVTFFRNAITSKQNEHGVFLCYTDFDAVRDLQ